MIDAEKIAMPKNRKALFFVTWGVALAATGGLSPLTILFLPLFPAGLAVVLPGNPDDFQKIAFIVAGWLFYVLHGFWTLRTKSGLSYWVLYGILFVVLAVNMHGCQNDLVNVAHIH
jgi:hypothetical protein